jgi:hypothetical protein
MWILGSFKRDLSIFHFSGIFALLFYLIFKENLLFVVIWSFVFFQIVDVGHNYITFWRTLFKKVDDPDSKFYWLILGGSFLLISIWLLLEIPYYWTFALYFIVWHHIRQLYGINRWYQRLNNRFCKFSNHFLYLLTFGPFITFHFRKFPPNPDLNRQLFTLQNETIFHIGVILCFLILIFWILHEIKLYRSGIHELNRFLSLAVPISLHFYCFLFSKTYLSIFFPLLTIHGLSYMAIMGKSLNILNPKKSLGYFMALVSLSLIAFGICDYLYDDLVIKKLMLNGYPKNYLFTLLIALTGTASLFHCIADGILWTRNNPEAKKIIKPLN